ncbi:L-aspartate oxidase [Aquibacillus salsiterrae]|uniref:L-aspartate oxidase n=1 Tax=Aquibacillus salsiterrae TaxID=2950439 RepID=A0A9X3WDW8_9BACI|nr:L-aspartate oxidase [Aquibacillus salsiterrae]MDC3415654.1 L-aspartate oxidase [Aquibacillus salsiterrae]
MIEKETVIIIGCGLAALTLADKIRDNKNVIVLTKSSIRNSNSIRAQGGIACVVDPNDNCEKHYMDTIVAGCKFNDEQAVETLVNSGPIVIEQLMNKGFLFDQDSSGKFLLGKEGAHQQRRILHAGGDSTGKRLMDFLINRISGNVTIMEEATAVELIVEDNQCLGVITCNKANEFSTYYANHIVLATGGCGAVYQVTSNDPSVMGDGIALAYRAGAKITDMEFIQFHPTMLCSKGQCYGLVSEAVRGEGAILRLKDGTSIMNGVHPLLDLAPRDIVAREIHRYVKQGKEVFLDISMINDFEHKFPTITSLCEQANISTKDGRIPVAPGAHFCMGGVKTDLLGLTTVKGLYAIGEVANNGVHGANRLASNSLLEGLVYSNLLGNYLMACTNRKVRVSSPASRGNANVKRPPLPTTEEVRAIMSKYVGIERCEKDLLYAKSWIEKFSFQMFTNEQTFTFTLDEHNQINLLTTCWLIVTSALQRTESRGAHYRSDYPVSNDNNWQNKHIEQQNKETIVAMTGVGK